MTYFRGGPWLRLRLGAAVLLVGFCAAGAAVAENTSSSDGNGLSEVEQQLQAGLELRIDESGPYLPWRIQVTNTSTRHIRVGTDPRLLSFTATIPGRKKPSECRIPDDMRPSRVEHSRVLAPREHFEFLVNPRFYCFEEGDQSVLVPGTRLVPYFGWREQTKTKWERGKRVEVRLTQEPPFVAKLAAAPGPPAAPEPDEVDEESEADGLEEDASNEDEANEAEQEAESAEFRETDPAGFSEPEASEEMRPEELSSGLKQLQGQSFALNSSYIEWAQVRLEQDDPKGPKLGLEVVRGSDSKTASGARVTVKISNKGKQTQTLFIRREHLSFLLLGPGGVLQCPAPDEERAPDRAAFTRLGAGQSTSLVTRILEFCPAEHLNRPGFYLLAAELNVNDNGTSVGVDAYTGKLFSSRLRPLRIRSGELPFFHGKLPSLQQARKDLADRGRALRPPTEAVGTFRKRPGSTPGGVPAAAAPTPPPAVAPTPPPSATE